MLSTAIMSLAKLPFLASGLVAIYVLMSSPQPKVPVEKHAKNVNAYERFFSAAASNLLTAWRTFLSIPMILEMVVIIASQFPSNPVCKVILRDLVNGPLRLTARLSLSLPFVIAWGIGVVNTLLRYECYQVLGRSFTLELTTRAEQELVTAGPYAYVRHPSYTTGVAGILGFSLVHLAQGSWVAECGVLQTPLGKTVAALYWGIFAFNSLSLVWRTIGEDEMLRKHFGKKWDAYAKDVPYRLIPHVF